MIFLLYSHDSSSVSCTNLLQNMALLVHRDWWITHHLKESKNILVYKIFRLKIMLMRKKKHIGKSSTRFLEKKPNGLKIFIIFHVNFLNSHWLTSVCQFSLSHRRAGENGVSPTWAWCLARKRMLDRDWYVSHLSLRFN